MAHLQARQQQGEARDEGAPSISGMISTLVPVLISALVLFAIFLILRKSHRRFYAPRTYLGNIREHERTPALSDGLFGWIGGFWKIPDVHALKAQSLDAYLFLRFLRVGTTMCLVGLLMTWPVLFPINATGGNGQRELDILSMSNINTDDWPGRHRLFAHAILAWFYYGFVLYFIVREMIFYINLRQAFLLSPNYANRISSRTVLFTAVPEHYLDEPRIRKLFSDSVKRVWISGDTKELDDLVDDRDSAAMKLESAEVKLIKAVNKERIKAAKKGGSAAEKSPRTASNDTEPGHAAARWLPKKKRPTHRLGKFGLYGKKVDSIDWARAELQRLIPAVDAAQADFRSGNFKRSGGVFVEFFTQSDAQAAFQVLTHHQALQMSPAYIGVTPGEIIWKSLKISWWQKIVRRYVVIAFITVMIIFWAIPVAFVASIAQVDYLIELLPFLSFLNQVPDIIMGVVTGLLPSVAMAILMSLVPIVMRLCAKLAGEPSLSRVELFTQNAYFAFQLIQVFLVSTMSQSAASAVEAIIDNPNDVFSMLADSIPKSSNFYISYFIVQGLGIAAGVVSQVAGFVIFSLLYKFLTSTPRSMYVKWTQLSAISWGSTLPVFTNIIVISITYSIIAPLMLFWSTIGIGLFYVAYRYNILFVTDTQIDTRGLIYPRALKQLLAGVYIAEVCLIGMFAVSRAIGPVIIAVILLITTAIMHMTVQKALDPLLYNLPRTLQVEEEELLRGDIEAANSGESMPGAENSHTNEKSFKKRVGALKNIAPGGDDNIVEKRGNIVSRFLKPWHFADYHTLRQLVPQGIHNFEQMYPDSVEEEAYLPPSVSSKTPLLWIPRDEAGVSRDEVLLTSKVIPITDEGASLDEKNKLVWDAEGARPPIWDEKIYY